MIKITTKLTINTKYN